MCYISMVRSSHPEALCKNGVLRNFAKFTAFTKFTGKHLCHSLLFNKVADLRPATLLITSLSDTGVSCEFCQISNKTFSYRIHPAAAYKKC